MNNKGQSLIIFVLLLPIITLFLAFFIDSSLSIMEKNKIDGIITSNIKEALSKDLHDTEKIGKVIKKNIDIDVIVSINENILKINARKTKKSIFAKILDFSWYRLEFNYCGNYLNKEIDKKCK